MRRIVYFDRGGYLIERYGREDDLKEYLESVKDTVIEIWDITKRDRDKLLAIISYALRNRGDTGSISRARKNWHLY